MKKIITIVILSCVVSNAFAELSTDDFNQMIQENQKSEADLRKKLQKEAGIDLRKEQYGKVDKSKLERPQVAEQVAAAGEPPAIRKHKDESDKELQRSAMKRVADELTEADSQ